jgi:hypothetical protein
LAQVHTFAQSQTGRQYQLPGKQQEEQVVEQSYASRSEPQIGGDIKRVTVQTLTGDKIRNIT